MDPKHCYFEKFKVNFATQSINQFTSAREWPLVKTRVEENTQWNKKKYKKQRRRRGTKWSLMRTLIRIRIIMYADQKHWIPFSLRVGNKRFELLANHCFVLTFELWCAAPPGPDFRHPFLLLLRAAAAAISWTWHKILSILLPFLKITKTDPDRIFDPDLGKKDPFWLKSLQKNLTGLKKNFRPKSNFEHFYWRRYLVGWSERPMWRRADGPGSDHRIRCSAGWTTSSSSPAGCFL